jgi:hypothetical protein
MDEKKTFQKPRSLFFPLLLVTIGVFLLLTNLGYVKNSSWDLLRTYWPLIFVAGGLDGLYRRDGWVGPLVSLGLGTVLILGNLGYLPWGGWNLLWRLWPILLIAWGLDVAFAHQKSLWSTIGRVALGLLLVGGIIWLSVASPLNNSIKTMTVSQSLDGARRSAITLKDNVGEFALTGDAAQDKLITGTVGIPENMTLITNYTAPKDGVSAYGLEPSGVIVVSTKSDTSIWKFKLNSYIPLSLDSEMAVGNMVLDLSDTMVEDINAQMAVGQTYINFPAKVNITGEVQGAVGETILRFPKGTDVTIHFSGGLTTVQLAKGFTRSGNEISSDFAGDNTITLDVNQAVGTLVVEWY